MNDGSKIIGILDMLRNQATGVCDILQEPGKGKCNADLCTLAADALEMSRDTVGNLSSMYDKMASEAKSLREELQRVKAEALCPDCNGTTLPMCGPKCEHFKERNCVDVDSPDGRCGVCSTCRGTGGKYPEART